MITNIVFSFVAGFLTILIPCIWPVLPVLLVSANGNRAKPYGIVLGIVTSFTVFTFFLTLVLKATGFSSELTTYIAAFILFVVGLVYISPKLFTKLEVLLSKISNNVKVNTSNNTFGGGFIVGLSLGILWSPCAGPLLFGLSALFGANQILQAVLLLVVYLIGLSLPLFLLTVFGQKIFSKSKFISKNLQTINKIFGLIIIIFAIAIAFNIDKKVQKFLLQNLSSPVDLQFKIEQQVDLKL